MQGSRTDQLTFDYFDQLQGLKQETGGVLGWTPLFFKKTIEA